MNYNKKLNFKYKNEGKFDYNLNETGHELIGNINFRNNQNYIISDFSRFKFYRTYYKTWFQDHAINFIFFIIFIILPVLLLIGIFTTINIEYLLLLFTFLITFVPILLIFDGLFYFLYKKNNFINKRHSFKNNRYIFFKNPKKKASNLNRRDFISLLK